MPWFLPVRQYDTKHKSIVWQCDTPRFLPVWRCDTPRFPPVRRCDTPRPSATPLREGMGWRITYIVNVLSRNRCRAIPSRRGEKELPVAVPIAKRWTKTKAGVCRTLRHSIKRPKPRPKPEPEPEPKPRPKPRQTQKPRRKRKRKTKRKKSQERQKKHPKNGPK